MKQHVSLLLIVLILGLGSVQAQAQKRDVNFEKAAQAYDKGDYKTALTFYNKSLASGLDPYRTLVGRAECYYALQEFEKSKADFEKAISMDPEFFFAYLMRAFTIMFEDPEQAGKDFDFVIAAEPTNANAYIGRAHCYRIRRDFTKALADINKALILDSTLYDMYGVRAMTNTDMGRYENAVSDIKLLQREDTEKKYSYYLVNVIEPLARLRRFREALDYYKLLTSAELGEVNDESYKYYVVDLKAVLMYLDMKDYMMAESALNEIQKNYSSDTSGSTKFQNKSYSFLLSLKGYALENLDKPDEAAEAYQVALIFNDAQPEVKAGLARVGEKKKTMLVQNDTEDPQIIILEPANSRSISIEDDKPATAQQRIRGQVKDASGVKSVKVNNVLMKVEENGYFETVLPLIPGRNTFSVVAIDNAANVTSVNVEVEAGKSSGTPPSQPAATASVIDNAPVYHAILIAESEYADKNIKSLPGPVSDLERIHSLLVNQYNFESTKITKLVNASKTNLLETIAKVANLMTPTDNLFIFYAGHGLMVKRPDGKEDGYLVPSDAIKGALSTYIRGDDIFRSFEFSKAKHILVVADACFAGSLFRSMSTEAEVSVQEAYKDQSRKVLASGNRSEVPDHSRFIDYLQTTLLNNRKKYVTAEQIVNAFKTEYINETGLNLQYYPIAGVDLGGQFVFMRK